VQVETGITDHTYTQVAQLLHGKLNAGDQLVIGATTNGAAKSGVPGGMRMR
jgi:hypothetical protein